MSMSLRDQLLQAGLVTEKQVRQAEEEKRRQARAEQAKRSGQPKGSQPNRQLSKQQLAAQQAQAAKIARDRELNRKQQEKAERKARIAQVKQLIEQYRVPRVESDDYFNFVDGKMIRRIAVNPELRARIGRGELTIVRCEGTYAFVPNADAERIRALDPNAIVPYNVGPEKVDENDPYKDHPIPDDLMW